MTYQERWKDGQAPKRLNLVVGRWLWNQEQGAIRKISARKIKVYSFEEIALCPGNQEKLNHLNEIIRGLKQIVRSDRETLTLLRFVANVVGAVVFSQGISWNNSSLRQDNLVVY